MPQHSRRDPGPRVGSPDFTIPDTAPRVTNGARPAAKKRSQLSTRLAVVGAGYWGKNLVRNFRELVTQGELGRLEYIYSNRLNLGKIRREENILWSFAPHDISVILGLTSEMPDAVQSQGGSYLHPKIADVTMSVLSFASGVRAHI